MNLRFALWTLGLVVVGGGLVHLIHGIQNERNATVLLERAAHLSRDGEIEQAIGLYQQYVLLRPVDAEAWSELGRMLGESAGTESAGTEEETRESTARLWRAYLANERALRIDGERDETRRRNARIAIRLRDYRGAQDHIELLLQESPRDGELQFLNGLCYERSNNAGKAVDWYRNAIQAGFDQTDVFLRLAGLLRGRLRQKQQADQVVKQMMNVKGKSAEAYRARAIYRRSIGSLDDALLDAEQAVELAPDSLDSLLLHADLALLENDASAGTLDSLRQSLESLLDETTPPAGVYDVLARIHLRQGNRTRAIEILRRGCKQHLQSAQLSWRLADQLIASGDVEEARHELSRLREIGAWEIPILYLRARILMADGAFAEASRLLETVEAQADRESMLFRFTMLFLGACYGQMGQPEEQLAACDRLLRVDRLSVEARLGRAEALERLGKDDEAAVIYRAYPDIPGVPLRLARLTYRQQQRLPASRRHWAAVNDAIKRAEAAEPDSVEVKLLRAAYLRGGDGDDDAAGELIDSLREKAPESVHSWTAAFAVAMREEDWRERADAILQNAEQKLGDRVELRLSRATYVVRVGGRDVRQRLRALEENRQGFSSDENFRLLEGLAQIRYLTGDGEAARRLWKDVYRSRPDHVPAQFRLLRFAIATDDEPEVDLRLRALQRIEGRAGPHVLVGKAMRLIARARSGEAGAAGVPQGLLLRASKLRPDWAIIPLASAEIEEHQGNLRAALGHYQRAISLENRDPAVLRRCVELMVSRDRSEEADRLIADLLDNSPIAVRPLLRKLQVEVALERREMERAERLLSTAVSFDSRDSSERLWLGQMLVRMGQSDEAERHFQAAVDLPLAPPDAWVGLVGSLARAGRRPDALAVVSRAEKRLVAAQAFEALARCYEAVADLKRARQNYRRAAAMTGKEVSGIRSQVGFLIRTGSIKEAEGLLASVLDRRTPRRPIDIQWARRALAQIKARLDYQQFQEALKLLEENSRESEDSSVDRRLKAQLLATRSLPHDLRKARGILEALPFEGSMPAEDRLLLASICDRLGDDKDADAHWQMLAREQEDRPGYLARFIRRQLQRRDAESASFCLDRLEELEPKSFRTVVLRAHWLVLHQEPDRALGLLRTHLDEPQPEKDDVRASRLAAMAESMETMAAICEESAVREKFLNAAEAALRESVQKRPASLLSLATFLARRGDWGAALDSCEQAIGTVPVSQVNAAAIVIVRDGKASSAEINRVSKWLTDAVGKNEQSLTALVQLAEFQLSHERYEESAASYRTILRRSEKHIVAMNNLAWLLSVWKQDHQQARRLIDRAISIAGPLPSLLDTRGTIALGEGDYGEALNHFQNVAKQQNSAANHFHLALAYWKLNRVRAAQFNFDKARQAGLTAADLYPPERDDFTTLQTHLPQRANSGSENE